jgi:hypothetical protein
MAHDNYHQFYTWNGGTLVLDPGVFAYDEPHLRMCHRVPVQATGIDRVVDPYEQRYCAKPMRFMSAAHAQIPIEAAKRCDTIVAGRSYCCPPYEMPSDWRVDYLPLGYEAATEQLVDDAVEEVGVIVVNPAPPPSPPTLRTRIQAHPFLSVGIALMAGMVLGKVMEK